MLSVPNVGGILENARIRQLKLEGEINVSDVVRLFMYNHLDIGINQAK